MKYIDIAYFKNTYNSQHRGSYTDDTITYYIDLAETIIDNLVTNVLWNFNQAEEWRREKFKYAVAFLTEHWLKQGNTVSSNSRSGNIGSIAYDSVGEDITKVPKIVIDILEQIDARISISNLKTTGLDDIDGGYSATFASNDRIDNVFIEKLPGELKPRIYSKGKVLLVIDELAGGSIRFNTGQAVPTIDIYGDGNVLPTKDHLDFVITTVQNEIDVIYNSKANKTDVYTKTAVDTKNQQQDTAIRNTTNKTNNNANAIQDIRQILDQGGTAVEQHYIQAKTPVQTQLNLAFRQKLTSNLPALITSEIDTGLQATVFTVNAGGNLTFNITGNLEKWNTDILTATLELVNVADNSVLASTSGDIDFGVGSNLFALNVNLAYQKETEAGEIKCYLRFKPAVGQTFYITMGVNLNVVYFSSTGVGLTVSSDEVTNTSSVEGTNVTQALDKLQSITDNKVDTTVLNGDLASTINNDGGSITLRTNDIDDGMILQLTTTDMILNTYSGDTYEPSTDDSIVNKKYVDGILKSQGDTNKSEFTFNGSNLPSLKSTKITDNRNAELIMSADGIQFNKYDASGTSIDYIPQNSRELVNKAYADKKLDKDQRIVNTDGTTNGLIYADIIDKDTNVLYSRSQTFRLSTDGTITNSTTLDTKTDVTNNTSQLSAYKSDGSPVDVIDDEDLATKKYVDDHAGGTSLAYTPLVLPTDGAGNVVISDDTTLLNGKKITIPNIHTQIDVINLFGIMCVIEEVSGFKFNMINHSIHPKFNFDNNIKSAEVAVNQDDGSIVILQIQIKENGIVFNIDYGILKISSITVSETNKTFGVRGGITTTQANVEIEE